MAGTRWSRPTARSRSTCCRRARCACMSSTRPTRPATLAEREMNSTTPTKMNIGESQDRSAENSTAMRAVPTSAPRITASAAGSVTSPCPTKEDVISEVAVLDCTRAVTPMPESAAVNRLRMLCTRILRRLAPNTRSTPVRTRCVPHTSNATAASRFRRCFMGGGFCPFRFASFSTPFSTCMGSVDQCAVVMEWKRSLECAGSR